MKTPGTNAPLGAIIIKAARIPIVIIATADTIFDFLFNILLLLLLYN
jgi:hypothetical protein